MNTIMKTGAALALAASLGACTTPAVIADINDSAVRVQGSPMWTGAVGLEVEPLADNIRKSARLAIEATPEQRAEARRLGSRFERTAQVEPAVARLTAAVLNRPVTSKDIAA